MTRRIVPIAALLALAHPASALDLAPLFQNGAVLQRDKPVPVWGHAAPNAQVTVTFGGQSQTTTTDTNGRWKLSLAPLATSAEGRTLTATEAGAPPVEVKDILVGEVWLASGQSNMEFKVGQTRPEDQQLAASPTTATLRLFQVPHVLSHTRQETVNAHWTPATPETIHGFSAVAYFFGRGLSEDLKIPVGLIESDWGGSRIEPWFADEGLTEVPELAALEKHRRAAMPGSPEYDQPYRAYLKATRDWTATAEQALDAGKATPDMPKPPALLALGSSAEVGTYQAMIHPLTPYALRGFLWYQGESNNGEGMGYAAKMEGLIAGWRKQFANPGAPFLYVQIAPYNYGEPRNFTLPELQVAQQSILKKVPNTGMAVTNDVGNPADIHPTNKSDVAARLLRWALADTYGHKGIVKSGPTFNAYKVEGGMIRIAFNDTGTGLVTRDGQPPNCFEVAGDDGIFSAAEAKIADNHMVVVKSAAVPAPTQVRFAWSQVALPNLMNREGLPASCFHTHWPTDPTLGKLLSKGKPFVSSHPNKGGWLGLNDGTWGAASESCYASDNAPTFPKTATIDLGSSMPLAAIRYGVPPIGATKTVAVALSENGTDFVEVGRKEFPPKLASIAIARFPARSARYVRVTFVDHHAQQDQYDANFAFLSELEAYGPVTP